MNKMWMMGYNDGGGDFNLGDSFNGAAARKLRPLIPRPAPIPSTSATFNNNSISTMSDLQCLTGFHGTHDLFALNHHLAVAEQNKRDFNAQQVVVSSRWNPTPEQLQTLEELYRRGTRTPNADEIQHITAQLRRYGKIEGKNVFYWFQNHKARERQKRRRQLETFTDRKDSAGGGRGVNNRTGYEAEQTKNWGNPTNCTSTFSEKNVWMEGETTKAECSRGADVGWLHFEETDMHLQQQQHHTTTTIRNMAERNATWHMMSSPPPQPSLQPSLQPPPPPPATTTTHNLINTCYTISPTSTTIITSSTTSPSTVQSPSFTTSSDEGCGPYPQMFRKAQDFHVEESHETLQLFPLGSSVSDGNNGGKGVEAAEMGFPVTGNNHLGSRPFFEFLPLKN